MFRSAIPPPVAVVRQPPILQSAIQLTAAVVNQLSMIQSQLGTHPATISQLTMPQPSILPALSGHSTPTTVSQPEILHSAVRSVLPVCHQQALQQAVSQQITPYQIFRQCQQLQVSQQGSSQLVFKQLPQYVH